MQHLHSALRYPVMLNMVPSSYDMTNITSTYPVIMHIISKIEVAIFQSAIRAILALVSSSSSSAYPILRFSLTGCLTFARL